MEVQSFEEVSETLRLKVSRFVCSSARGPLWVMSLGSDRADIFSFSSCNEDSLVCFKKRTKKQRWVGSYYSGLEPAVICQLTYG
jgi:hypothetical protein